jgi:uncharacterized protein (TIGR02271 family)
LDREQRTDRFTAVEDRYAGYTVYDQDGDKIGKVDDLFVDENDQPEYIGVKMGFFGTSSTLIPMDLVTADEQSQSLTVSQPKGTVKDGPHFNDDHEITPEYENEVRSYYGLGAANGADRGTYGDYYGDEHSGAGTTGPETAGTVGAGMSMGDTEEELRAGTREREAGSMRVRKRVRTDRERIEVPVRHEEVSVERVPVSGEATEAQIGEDEVSVPVTEEEVITDKRAVAKEEIRVRKDSVQDTEVVEEDVRREEVDVEDGTERGQGIGR